MAMKRTSTALARKRINKHGFHHVETNHRLLAARREGRKEADHRIGRIDVQVRLGFPLRKGGDAKSARLFYLYADGRRHGRRKLLRVSAKPRAA